MDPNRAVVHYTPNVAELLPDYEIICNIDGCLATFKNNGSYIFHKQRHHKLTVDSSALATQDLETCYHCPAKACKYSAELQGYFSNLRYLRQHYQKVHVPKTHLCAQCGKSFISNEKLTAHKCGLVFACSVCGWVYNTREALLTHAKRKGHEQQEHLEQIKAAAERLQSKVAIPRLSNNISSIVKAATQENADQHSINYTNSSSVNLEEKQSVEQETQTPAKHMCAASIQTEQHLPCDDIASMLDNPFVDALLKDIETQTELFPLTTTCASTNTTLDAMLGQPLSDMHTQTYVDDFLNDLCLTDTQTQTYWPPLLENNYEHQAEAGVQCTTSNEEELFVSTETQTSFSQYFMDSDAATSMSAMDISQHFDHNHQAGVQSTTSNEEDLFVSTETQTSLSQFFLDSFKSASDAATSMSTMDLSQHIDQAGMPCVSNDEELFVSTETQTSFTQYFLDSCKSAADAATSMSAMDFIEQIDYNNQYTQTCDMLLENLFGDQENDLITSFQSSYTQT